MNEKDSKEELLAPGNPQGKNRCLVQHLITVYFVILLVVWFLNQSVSDFIIVLGGPFLALAFTLRLRFTDMFPYSGLILLALTVVLYVFVMLFITKKSYNRWPIPVHLIFHITCLVIWLLLGGHSLMLYYANP